MKHELSVIIGGMAAAKTQEQMQDSPDPEERLRHFRNVTVCMTEEALRLWAEIYGEFDGTVTYGTMITANAKKGFHPHSGWPEFLEKMRLLERYLDHLKRLAEGRA